MKEKDLNLKTIAIRGVLLQQKTLFFLLCSINIILVYIYTNFD